MLVELSVRFTSDDTPDSPIQVSLLRQDKGVSTTPTLFTPPLAGVDLNEIRWYLEAYFEWPTEVDRLRAERIEQKLETWRNTLHTAVFKDEDSARLWQQFIDDPNPEKLLTIDATDPRVLHLPWELLADKSGPIFVRKIGVPERLSDDTQAALPALAVFQGGALESLMLVITEIDPDLWKRVRAELEAAALVTVENNQGFVSPFLHFHPALLSNLRESLSTERHFTLETRFWQYYYWASGAWYHVGLRNSRHSHIRTMVLLEMPNLHRAFDLALAAALRGETDAQTTTDFAEYMVEFLDIFGRRRELDALRQELKRLAPLMREVHNEEETRVAHGEQAQNISVDWLIDMVGQVERHETPPGDDHEFLHWRTRELALDQHAPREVRALGNVLHKVLMGSRTPDLARLSEDLARQVQAMLDTLKGA